MRYTAAVDSRSWKIVTADRDYIVGNLVLDKFNLINPQLIVYLTQMSLVFYRGAILYLIAGSMERECYIGI